MAVTIQTAEEKSKAFALKFFGLISPEAAAHAEALQGAGATLTVAFTAFTASYQGTEFLTYPLPVNSTAVLKNAVGASMVEPLQTGVLKALKEACVKLDLYKENGKWPGKAPKGVPVDIKPAPEVEVLKKPEVSFDPNNGMLKVKGAEKASQVTGPAVSFTPFTAAPAPAPTGSAVPLIEATALNQPVKGTNASSVYRVIALSPDLKCAARVKGNELSVRFEGKLTSPQKAALAAIGFSDKGHYSAHYTVEKPALALGAILMAPEFDWAQRITSMKEVAGG